MRKFLLSLALICASWAAQAQPFSPYGGVLCNKTAIYDASSTGATQMVALLAGAPIYVCGYVINVGATATNVSLVYGTGTNCATGQVSMTPLYILPINGLLIDETPFGNAMATAVANALCVNTSGANPVKVLVRYTQGLSP